MASRRTLLLRMLSVSCLTLICAVLTMDRALQSDDRYLGIHPEAWSRKIASHNPCSTSEIHRTLWSSSGTCVPRRIQDDKVGVPRATPRRSPFANDRIAHSTRSYWRPTQPSFVFADDYDDDKDGSVSDARPIPPHEDGTGSHPIDTTPAHLSTTIPTAESETTESASDTAASNVRSTQSAARAGKNRRR